ncbi:MAG: Stk1 family PASTA domain-containing Ser/Thr kinase [Clostridia bacterium]|nr:Stk1 family PASTA domain-containing Ser/Thr kinase [Clostridia bacterium]
MDTELIGKVLGNRYEIIEKIGTGGMATVYKARCRVLNRFVAVKILKEEFANDAEFIKRFQVEAQAAASLSQQNIVSIFDVGNDSGRHYIVMELIEGKTLKEIITEKGALPWKDAVKIAAQIALGLSQAHKNHIVHRDIKPHNIIITKDGVAKVTDFGIAKAVSNSTINAHGMTMGSVHYFSPEQARGGYTDEKTDIYSLGVVLYEMTTGKVPFDADSPVSVALKHLQETAEEPISINKDIPESLNGIIVKAMQKEVANRYQSADAMYSNLTKILKNPDDVVVNDTTFNASSSATQRIPVVGSNITKDDVKEKKFVEQDDEDMGRKKGMTKKRALARFFIIVIVAIALFFGFVQIGKFLSNVILGGNTIIEVPKIVGYNEEEATKMLEELGLKMEVTGRVVSEEYVIAGFVTWQEYAEGTELRVGDTVEVRVSKGSAKVLVPNVTEATTLREAKMKIENESLVYVEVFEISDEIPSGEIIRQEPEVNTEVEIGSEVKVFISMGNESGDSGLVKVPELVGKTEAEARQLLDDANLIVDVTYQYMSTKEDGVVLIQSVDAGSYMTELSTIEIIVNSSEKANENGNGNDDPEEPTEDPNANTPATTAKRKVTIDLSTLGTKSKFNVKVVLEGNLIGKRVEYEGEHSRDEGKLVVEVSDVKNAMLKIYVDDEVVSEKAL